MEFISHHIKKILYVNTNSKGNQPWNKNKDNNFHLFLILTLKNPVFLCRFIISYQQFLMFLSFIIVTVFMNIFRRNHSQVFFKIGALKIFAIFWIKKRLQTFKNCFFTKLLHFLKIITAILQRCEPYDFLIIFSSQHIWCIKSWTHLFINLSSIVRFSK